MFDFYVLLIFLVLNLKIIGDGQLNLLEHSKNVVGAMAVDPKLQYVPRIKNETKRREPKLHCCYICKSMVVDQIRRHILKVHSNSETVKDIIKTCPTDELLHSAITDLINLGDYWYNNDPISHGKEKLVARKPNKKSDKDLTTKDTENSVNTDKIKGDQWVLCPGCLKSFRSSTLRKHQCSRVKKMKDVKGNLCESRNLVPDIHPDASDRLRTRILKIMQHGEIRNAVKMDHLIILYGNSLVEYYTHDQHTPWISHQLRLLAELFLLVQKECPAVNQFSDVLDNVHASAVTKAIQIMMAIDFKTGKIAKGNKCREMSSLLNKVIDFYKYHCTEKNMDKKHEKATKFETLMTQKFKLLNKQSRDCVIEQSKSKGKQKVPTVSDIKKLCEYTEEIRSDAHDILQKEFNYHAWRDLNESTLLSLQIFNRKRQGEISRLLISDLDESQMYKLSDDCDGDEYNRLDDRCKEAAKGYIRISITNKKGLRTVGLILHQNTLDSINLILKYRKQAQIRLDNKYVFAKRSYDPSRDSHFIACDIMRDYSTKCDATDPESLRGTFLRKQIATMMYGIQIGDETLRDLASFLGHDYEIHKNYYRQKIPVRELITLAPLLMQAQGHQENQAKQSDSNNTKDAVCKSDMEDVTKNNVSSDYLPSTASSAEGLYYVLLRSNIDISSAWCKTVSESQNLVGNGTNSDAGSKRYQLASRSFLFNFKESNQVKQKIFFILCDIFFTGITRLYIFCILYSLIIILRFVSEFAKLIKKTRFVSWYLLQLGFRIGTFLNRVLNWYCFAPSRRFAHYLQQNRARTIYEKLLS